MALLWVAAYDRHSIDILWSYWYASPPPPVPTQTPTPVEPEEMYQVVTHDYQDLIEFAKQIMSYVKESTH